MFQSIWEDIKSQFRMGNMVLRIILVNFAFFTGILVLKLLLSVFVDFSFPSTTYENNVAPFLELSTDFLKTLTRPWVLFTHMFMHYGVFHFVFNMLFLYWFGRIVGDLIGDRKILPIYLLSGLASAFLLMIMAALPTSFSLAGSAIGASGAVLGIVVAAAAIAPDYYIRLILLGDVRLKYVALAVIIMQLVSLVANNNAGGTFGHIGGILMGLFFVSQLRKGNDFSIPINNLLDKILGLFEKKSQKTKNRPKVVYRSPELKKRQQERKRTAVTVDGGLTHEQKLNGILDKIKSTGMDSLSEEEKEFLLNASKK